VTSTAETSFNADKSDVGGYEQIAAEYYDATRHPTCRNFRDASALYIEMMLPQLHLSSLVVEVGAGCSVLGEKLVKEGCRIENLLLTDSSATMLMHSRQFRPVGASLVVADATALPLHSKSASTIVASLGDPYNTVDFWNEVARCLGSGGKCIFTTPAHEWADSFRRSNARERSGHAYFDLLGGRRVYVPSIIHRYTAQKKLIERTGMRIIDLSPIYATAIPRPHSPKIVGAAARGPVLTGYTIVAPN
jgi:ubiquinone/menaquinone biosynthesis C-methylase UbiE